MDRAILWTGGFDSTWLVVDALLAGDHVRALTWRGNGCISRTWQKPRNEDAARDRIAAALPLELARRLERIVEEGHGPETPTGRNRYMALDGERRRLQHELVQAQADVPIVDWGGYKGRYSFSQQSPLVGAMPLAFGTPVESAYVAGDDLLHPSQARVREVMAREGVLFPLAQTGKAELLEDARRRGFAHLLDLTWSCEGLLVDLDQTTRRTPCGKCAACQHRILPALGRGDG